MTSLSFPHTKTVVVGPGIVGMPMAALLADAARRLDNPPGEVVVIQRNSGTSGWKVDAINRGQSPIGGVEPDLDHLVAVNVEAGTLRAAHSYSEAENANVILVCVQTDRDGMGPDYGPLLQALHGIASALSQAPHRTRPLIVIESTLAPSSMQSVVAPLFASYGLHDGVDILLGNSPNRVMPGRLVSRVAAADKIVGALRPATASRIAELYSRIVTGGRLLQTSSLTAEVVKTLENAYRDVRIAFAADLVRWCDERDIDFFGLRERLNAQLERADHASYDPGAIPSGSMLVPTVGVGGHCLPKDGILLWWRAAEAGLPTHQSLILESRRINDESPAITLGLARKLGASLNGQRVTVLGAAYRPDSEDTRNSPAAQLALLLRDEGADVVIHDPHVRAHDANLERLNLQQHLAASVDEALAEAEVVFVATGHAAYRDLPLRFPLQAPHVRYLIDASNLFVPNAFDETRVHYAGIGRGKRAASLELEASVLAQFRALERGVANEVAELTDFLNAHFATETHEEILFEDVQALARTCATGCDLVDRGAIRSVPHHMDGFVSRLSSLASARWGTSNTKRPIVAPRDRRPMSTRQTSPT